jgi:hypothetical protein
LAQKPMRTYTEPFFRWQRTLETCCASAAPGAPAIAAAKETATNDPIIDLMKPLMSRPAGALSD